MSTRNQRSPMGKDAPFPFAKDGPFPHGHESNFDTNGDDVYPWPWRTARTGLVQAGDGGSNPTPPPGYSEHPGRGTYTAERIGTTLLLTAEGDLPNMNEIADIRELPWRVFPPQFGMYFYIPKVTLPALRHFRFTEQFGFPADIAEVTIHDADGSHLLKIVDLGGASPFAKMLSSGKEGKTNPVEIGIGSSLQDAFDQAVARLPARLPDAPDSFLVYTIIEMGRFRGGIGGADRHYARVEAKPGSVHL